VDFQSYSETAWLGALTRAPIRVGRRYKTESRWLYRPWIDAEHPQTYMPFAHLDTLVRAALIAAPEAGAAHHLAAYFRVPTAARTAWAVTAAGLDLPATTRRVGLFVGAAETNRRWPAERFAQLAVALNRDAAVPLSFLVFAGPAEIEVADAVVAASAGTDVEGRVVHAPTASLLELAAAFEDCALAICNDTGPLHLSAAVGTPTCGIYRRPLAHFLLPPPHSCVVAPDLQIDRIEVAAVLAATTSMLSPGTSVGAE
jgi:ADP-heptose:LPS heptosyltransferase